MNNSRPAIYLEPYKLFYFRFQFKELMNKIDPEDEEDEEGLEAGTPKKAATGQQTAANPSTPKRVGRRAAHADSYEESPRQQRHPPQESQRTGYHRAAREIEGYQNSELVLDPETGEMVCSN